MPTRRAFLQATAASTALAPSLLSSAASQGRVALAIGNAAYRAAPLRNPTNDAKAVSRLFADAGLEVETLTDASRAEMIDAIGRFVVRSRRPETRQIYFYYAGHGVQLDWRNYLLAVDSEVTATDQIKARCVDLGLLLGGLAALKGKTLVVILDACRNEPFGTAYRPEQRGLSQLDAPANTLLAYSTSPGSVASDGGSEHGLYTEHLLKEFAVRQSRLEDAFKRVRLAVRLSSRDTQIPWESTSLENDVYLYDAVPKRITDAEKARELEADLAAFERIRASRDRGDWVEYLQRYPNGRFAEIAHVRLARLTGEPGTTAPGQGVTHPRVANEADYGALPAGTLYFDPGGRLRRKSR